MAEFLAIDIGASSGRHILGRIENGKLKLEEIHRFPNSPQTVNGRLVWDTERLFGEIVTGLKKAKELGRIPVSVAIDTWGVDYVLLNKEGKRLGDVYSYREPRTEDAMKWVHSKISVQDLYARVGIQTLNFNTIYRLVAEKQEGRLQQAESLLMLPDYFHYLLTGKQTREYTNASTTGFINARTRTWDKEVLALLELDEKFFPQTIEAGTVIGEFTPEIQQLVGYNAKVVAPPTHDTASAVVGSIAQDYPFLSSGTWSLLGVEQSVPHTDALACESNFTNEGHVCGKYRFLKNITGLWMVNRLKAEECPDMGFAELTALAAQSQTDAVVNVNDERFLAPKNMKQEIESASGKSLTLGEAVYCALNSLALCYKDAIEELEKLVGRKFDKLNILGGGSKNVLLNELTHKHTGKQIVTGPTEATVAGNLALQMIAAGLLKDIDEAKNLILNTYGGQ